jgi:TPR repeat protein
MNQLGSMLYNEQKNYNQAAEWFRKAAQRGCTRALNNLGICYELGHGVDQDLDQAYHLYKESTEKGYVPAMYNLAFVNLFKARQSKSP